MWAYSPLLTNGSPLSGSPGGISGGVEEEVGVFAVDGGES